MKSKSKTFCSYCSKRLMKKSIEGRPRLYCPHCSTVIYENPVPSTAAVIINDKAEVLLVKRAIEPKLGRWCLPGGFVELFEEAQDCCLRELEEETGLTGEIESEIGTVLSTHPVYQSVLVIGFAMKSIKGSLKAGDDASEVKYFPLRQRPQLAFRSHEKLLANSLKYKRAERTPPYRSQFDLFNFGAYVITSGTEPLQLARQACQAGAKIVQYRDKKATGKQLLDMACKIRRITTRAGTLFIVNDFIDIALLAGADGVHLGQDDIPPGEARKMVPPDFLIGCSTHSLQQALKAQEEGADYIGIGPVFATPTKQDYIPIGLDTVRQVMGKVAIPVVAIGGLNLGNIGQLRESGVNNFAMVREFQQNTGDVVKTINKKIN